MELTQTERELTETIKAKPDWWVLRYKRTHYNIARFSLEEARRQPHERQVRIDIARLHRGLARVARREIQRRRDDIERDHV